MPRSTLVNVHVTVSPGSSLKVAVAVPTSPLLGVRLAPSSHWMAVRSQVAGTVSVEV
jgi:hypothetical protein